MSDIQTGSRVVLKSAPVSGRGVVERIMQAEPSPRVLVRLDNGSPLRCRAWDLLPEKING